VRIAVAHATTYRYAKAAALGPHTLRLRPRADGAQRLLRYSLKVDPTPAGCSEFLDQEGNAVVRAWFAAPARSLEIHSSFEVETLRSNPFDFLLEGEASGRVPMVYPEILRPVLHPYAAHGRSAAVCEFARAAAAEAGWRTMEFLRILNGRIFDSMRQVIREFGSPLAAGETLAAGEGSCRDLAVLFAEACRFLGLATRFVSGYETAAAEGERADMHAWAEVYLPGGGWRGYDPSRGLAVAALHVPVAASLEPDLAAPVTGSYGGAAAAELHTSIRLSSL
jgi:transglutaminase-like putative cysteine protease